MSSAQVQGELWGARADDWARLQEPAWQPVFAEALRRAQVSPGLRLLDVGCGSGGALALAHAQGAAVAGIDAAENLVAIARQRLPDARIEVGDMDALPFPDDSFDVVTGINALQFAADPQRALSEAWRVCRVGGCVLLLAWGAREDCELISVSMAPVLALLPAASASGARSASPPPDPMTSDAPLRAAGLEPTDRGEFAAELVYRDAETAVRAMMAAGATVRAARIVGDEVVRDTIRRTLARVTRSDGAIVWNNRFRWVRAHKREH